MRGFDPFKAFGAGVAEIYDDEPRGDEAETVAFFQKLARGGPALELAIGTGRIGLPLARTGVGVDGVEISPEMVAQLRAKPGGDKLAVTMGDFAAVPVEGSYRLIFVVYNTFFNLLTQDDQVRCFENVAAHLTDDGVFVIEAGVPTEFFRLRDGQYVNAETVEAGKVTLDVARFDAVTQVLEENHVTFTPNGIRLGPIAMRYSWPSELDLMARIAGLRLKERWGGWKGEPFTSDSRRHITVYGRGPSGRALLVSAILTVGGWRSRSASLPCARLVRRRGSRRPSAGR
jgi:SAM-dependent methyltransferase